MNTATVSNAGAGSLFNPHAYFKRRKGLCVSRTFKERILTNHQMITRRGLDGVTGQMLPRNMLNVEIIDELLGGIKNMCKHAFTLDQIAAMIDLQKGGEKGGLVNDGAANIFCLLVQYQIFFISVHWRQSGAVELAWIVNEWDINDRGYGASNSTKVFRNTTLTI